MGLHPTGKTISKWVYRKLPWEATDEGLNENLFTSMQKAKILVETWREEYNEQRPHSSLGGKTPNKKPKEEEKLNGNL